MVELFDYELRALEADSHAELARRVPLAENWRDIARGYRMLSDFLAHEQATQRHREQHEAA